MKTKKYICQYCRQPYFMPVNVYSVRTMNGLKRCCTKVDCMTEAAMKVIAKKKQLESKFEKQKWKERKTEYRFQVSKQTKEPLQLAINKIARLLDLNFPCLARPFEYSQNYDAGHIFSVGAHPSLRYHLWNIHKQSVKSNKYLGGEQMLMLEGIAQRYGEEIRQYIESLPQNIPTLKLTIEEKKEALKKANKIIKYLELGITYTRDEVNQIIGIYKV